MKRRFLDEGLIGWRRLVACCLVAIFYFAAAEFGFTLAFATKQVTAVWPPTGIAVVASLVLGPGIWPGIFLGAFICNAVSSEPLVTAFAIAVGNTLGPLLAGFLLRRTGFDGVLARVRDVFALLLLGAILSMTITATNGVVNLALAKIVPWSAGGAVWWIWWVGDAMGVLLVAPFLLTWIATPAKSLRRARLFELAGLFAALVVVGNIAFSSGLFSLTTTSPHIQYAVFPLLIWAGLRFGPRTASSAVLAIAAIAILATIHDRGPFGSGPLDERLALLDLFMATASVTALVLAAVTAERRRAEAARALATEELRLAHDELELRVRIRTAELANANVELGRKNEEIEAFVFAVSHDLRAPLLNLQGFSRELKSSCGELERSLGAASGSDVNRILGQEIPSALRFIAASTTKSQRLVDALLRLSQQGRQEYQRDKLDLNAIVASTLDSVRQPMQSAGVDVKVGPIPAAVGDATAIGQVFSNLIDNATHYLDPSRRGVIEIGGALESGHVHFWVRDNGVGIPAAAQRRLFQVFQRFHPTMAPGEGMGLAIVKRIVERHGGRVWAESEEGVGTTFHVWLEPADGATVPS